jgi:hypothetical protein
LHFPCLANLYLPARSGKLVDHGQQMVNRRRKNYSCWGYRRLATDILAFFGMAGDWRLYG